MQWLGRNDGAGLLQKTLGEVRATDRKLTTLAESKIIFGPRVDGPSGH